MHLKTFCRTTGLVLLGCSAIDGGQGACESTEDSQQPQGYLLKINQNTTIVVQSPVIQCLESKL